ncbi:MAG: hypothetical protein MUQ30_11270 [Anaerolineae bacterium]|nr:hypothetical protein [Anaerolineae bacterium]
MSDVRIDRWDWLLGSIILATLASLIHWLLHYLYAAASKRRSADPIGLHAPNTRVLRTIESSWITFPLRLTYAIGIPAAALFWQGALTARGLGLKPMLTVTLTLPDAAGITQGVTPGQAWGGDLNWLVVVAGLTTLVMAAGSRVARQLAPQATTSKLGLGAAFLEAVYHEVHWAFYREPFVYVWGIGLGSWLGALPVLLETGINLMFWERLHARGAAYQRRMLVRAGLFVAGTQLYVLTQNLWLAIALDALVGWLALRWGGQSTVPDQSVTSEAITTIR